MSHILTTREFREQMIVNKYRPLRVAPAKIGNPRSGKNPIAFGWTAGDSDDALMRYSANQNTGMLTAGLLIIDVDIDVNGVARAAFDAIKPHLPSNPLVRTRHGSTRFALVYRAEGLAVRKRPSLAGRQGRVDILSDGKQLVVHGVHWSGQRLEWLRDRSPATVPLREVPVILDTQIDAVLATLAPIIGASSSKPAGATVSEERFFAAIGANAELSAGIGDSDWFSSLPPQKQAEVVKASLDAIDNTTNDPRDQWLPVLFAVADAERHGCPNARSLALEWSKRGKGWTSEADFDAAWNSFKPGKVTIGTLLHFASDAGLDLSPWHAQVSPSNMTATSSPDSSAPVQNFLDPWAGIGSPAFPIDTLHTELGKVVELRSKTIGADMSAIALAAIAAVIAALDQSSRLSMTKWTDWRIAPRLWPMLVGDPSTKKTPVLDAMFRPIEEIDNALNASHHAMMSVWKQAMLAAKAAKQPYMVPEPIPPQRLVVRDITSEKLAEVLSRGNRGTNIIRDELAGFIGSIDRYANKGGGDRAFYLEGFNGRPFTKDRVSGEIYVENLSFNIIGSTQPKRLAELTDLAADGLLQRFIPVLMGSAANGEDLPDNGLVGRYADAVGLIYRHSPIAFQFSDPAFVVVEQARQVVRSWQQFEELGDGFCQWIGKLEVLFGSLCIALQVSDAAFDHSVNGRQGALNIPAIIDEPVARRALRIIDNFIIRSGAAFYSSVIPGAAKEMTIDIASYVLTSNASRFVPSDFSSGVRSLRGADPWKIYRHVGILVAGGWLTEEWGKNGGRTPKAWITSPGLREHFADRRNDERARKEAIGEKIRELAGGDAPC